jgi:hypothetical protein
LTLLLPAISTMLGGHQTAYNQRLAWAVLAVIENYALFYRALVQQIQGVASNWLAR